MENIIQITNFYIKQGNYFYDLKREGYVNYHDMEEIDRRYIDLQVDKWLHYSLTPL